MPLTTRIIDWLSLQPAPCYLVGGCIRDQLTGRPSNDLDIAVDGDGLLLARRLADRFGGAYYALDIERNAGRAILSDSLGVRLIVDVARLRGQDLAADLMARDFTINAMAADVRTPEVVIDLTGGVADLQEGLIRSVSEASIKNDPLRALRAVRQAAELEFSIAPETRRLIVRDGGSLADVSAERVRDELASILNLTHSATYLELLDELGLLCIMIPDLEALRGLAQSPPHHLDALSHSVETVRQLEILEAGCVGGGEVGADGEPGTALAALATYSDRLRNRFENRLGEVRPRRVTMKLAALLHDSGKVAARSTDEQGRIRFIGHERGGARITGETLTRLRFNKAEVRLAESIVCHHLRPILLAREPNVSSRAVYRFFHDTGQSGIDVLLHALADQRATFAQGTGDLEWNCLLSLIARMLSDYWERFSEKVAPTPLVNGHDIVREFDLHPGPQIGELLEAVREAQVDGVVKSRQEALDHVRLLLNQAGSPSPI